jgi:hypothetical protein
MNNSIRSILGVLLVILITTVNFSCKKEDQHTEKKYYSALYKSSDGWEIRLEEDYTGLYNGYITKIGTQRSEFTKTIGQKLIISMSHQQGNTYSGMVYDRSFISFNNGTMILTPPLLTIVPENSPEYTFDLVQ